MLATCLLVAGMSLPAERSHGAQFHVTSRTIADAYQLVVSDGSLVNRRRLHHALGLGAYDLLGDGGHQLQLVTLMRFDVDLAASTDVRDRVDGYEPWSLALQAAYLEGRDLFGMLDFRLGRQLVFDPMDYLMLDGLVATLRTPWFFGVEVLAGLESKNDLGPITATQLELDGVRKLEGGVTNDAVTVAVGVALVTDSLRYTRARVGYRRLFSEGHVDQEKLGASLYQRVVEGLHLTASASFDLYNLRFDAVDLGVRGQITSAWELEAQYVHLVPSFDADSIFNIFSIRPLNDLNLRARYFLSPRTLVYAGGMTRFFENDPYDVPDGAPAAETLVEAWGAMAGYHQSWGWAGRLAADLSYEGGYGGERFLVDIRGMWGVRPRVWELDARLTTVLFQDELQPNLGGWSVGYQLGARYRVDRRAALTLVAEHNMGRLYPHQLRVYIIADLDFFL